ncbi:MAG: chorismate synthase [Lachnospiraceae bacterium]
MMIVSGSTYGTIFRITTWGESHGAGVGVVVDGCPAGLSLTEADIQVFLDRENRGPAATLPPGRKAIGQKSSSGVFERNHRNSHLPSSCGPPPQRSADYSEIASYYRPGHADMTYDKQIRFPGLPGRAAAHSRRETIGPGGCRSHRRQDFKRLRDSSFSPTTRSIRLGKNPPRAFSDRRDFPESLSACPTQLLPRRLQNISTAL